MEKGGLSVYKKDSLHRSVLHQAARLNNVEAVKQVIATAGEQELQAKDINGRTPFGLAQDCGAHQVAEYLRAVYGRLPGMAEEANEASNTLKPNWSPREPLRGGKESIKLVSRYVRRTFLLIAAPSGSALMIVFILICICDAAWRWQKPAYPD
jgi:hypothetical protein